jgi:hypothetical protein
VVILNPIRPPLGIPNADSTFPANALVRRPGAIVVRYLGRRTPSKTVPLELDPMGPMNDTIKNGVEYASEA